MLETLDYTIRIGSTPTFLYFEFESTYVNFHINFQILSNSLSCLHQRGHINMGSHFRFLKLKNIWNIYKIYCAYSLTYSSVYKFFDSIDIFHLSFSAEETCPLAHTNSLAKVYIRSWSKIRLDQQVNMDLETSFRTRYFAQHKHSCPTFLTMWTREIYFRLTCYDR